MSCLALRAFQRGEWAEGSRSNGFVLARSSRFVVAKKHGKGESMATRSEGSAPPDVKKRAAWLAQEIERHNELYYVEATPEITDREFDALLVELNEIESTYPELRTPDSPTQRVGGRPLETFETVSHRVAMLSMENTYNLDELRAFDQRVRRLLEGDAPQYTCEPKIDGVSISVTYVDGVMLLGATRGDGLHGDNVTENLRTIRTLPLRLKGKRAPAVLEVRGEVFFQKKDFAAINEARDEAGEIPFANPRNAAAGTLKMLDAKLVAKRPLRIFFYGIGYSESLDVDDQVQALTLLREFGLPVVPEVATFDSLESMLQHVEQWEARRHELPFEVDGMVIKVVAFEQRERLGTTSKFPRWQVAYKYAAEQAVTQLERIEVQVGKTGKLTPVAHLTPVFLSGTTVSRASLHNDEEIERKDIRVGDWVVVEKAGEIIPQVVRVDVARRTGEEQVYRFPDHCPVCEGEVRRDEGGVYIRCTNPDCPAQIQNTIEFFAHRSAMDIEGLGPALVKQLYDSGLVRRLPDLYRLRVDDLVQLERMGKKSAQNLVESLEESKGRGLARLLVGLGIRHVGKRGAELLAEEFGSISALMEADEERLALVPEVGPVMASSIWNYFHTEGGDRVVSELQEFGVRMEEDRARSRGDEPSVFSGKTLVVTGKLKHYSRDGIHARIKELGGRASGSVSKKTDYLVVGEDAGSKLNKATELGIAILSEEDFRDMAGDAADS